MPDHVPGQLTPADATPAVRSSPTAGQHPDPLSGPPVVPGDGGPSATAEPLGPDGLSPSESQRQTRERLILFSDAVVAIALTLLALELPVPHGATEHEVWSSFVRLLPHDYLTFTISFLVTAGFWHTHHRLFQRVDRADAGLTRINLLCLMMIVLLPFASRVLGEDGNFPFGVIFYASTISATALCFLGMVFHAMRHSLTRAGVAPAVMRSTAVGISVVAGVFLVSIPVAIVDTDAATYTWLAAVAIPRIVAPLRRRWSAPTA